MPDTDETEEKSETAAGEDTGKTKKKRGASFYITVIVVLLIALYFAGVGIFNSRFLPNTYIDGVDCSFKTTEEATQLVQDHIASYQLTITEREGVSETISGASISTAFVDNGAIDSLLPSQNRFNWIGTLLAPKQSTTLSYTYDSTALDTVISKLNCMDATQMRAPSDVRPAYNGTEYTMQAADYGTTVDTAKAQTSIIDAISNVSSSVDLDKTSCYIDPNVTTATQEMKDKLDYYNKYLKFSITYTVGSQTDTLDANDAEAWLDFDSDGTATLNEDDVKAWLKQLGKKYDTVGTTRTFTSQDGSQCTVSGGTYGWEVDEDAEFDSVMSAFKNHTCETREPAWVQTAASHGAIDWGNTYIEISITDQHWWAVKDGVSVLDTDCVTGLPTEARHTPDGVWSILDKQSPYTMHGEQHSDGSYEYVTNCSYWMRVTWTGVGIHDASWQPWFGGDRYTTNGSHGCINTPPELAEELYGICEVGWPVVIHE